MSCHESRIRAEERYLNARKQLDDFGYHQVLGVESVALVEHLLADLLHITDCLNHYKDLTQKCMELQEDFDLGVEPYRQDNKRLIQECNELHMKLLYQQEDAEKNVRELKKKVRQLEKENGELVFVNSKYLAQVSQLELDCIQKSNSLLQLKEAVGKKKKPGSQLRSGSHVPDKMSEPHRLCQGQGDGQGMGDEAKSADQQLKSLTQLLGRMKDDCQQHMDLVNTLKLQIDARDMEIERLLSLLEGGRPLKAICKDYRLCEQENKVHNLEEELTAAEIRNNGLENELKDVTTNLHEAMSRAMVLADRNKELEEQLLGLTCSHRMGGSLSAKESTNTLINVQEQLKGCEERCEDLERDLQAARQKCRQLEAILKAALSDKQWLESQLDSMLKEKRRMVDRIDQFHIVEQDMLEERGRLKQANIQQRQQILELESQLKSLGVKERACQTNGAKNGSGRRSESGEPTADPNHLHATVAQQQQQQQQQQDQVDEWKQAHEESKQQLSSLQRTVCTLEQKNSSLKTELELLQKSNSSLSSQVQELTHVLTEKDQQLATLQQELRSQTAQLQHFRSSNQVSVSQGAQDDQLKDLLAATQTELSKQRTLYNQIKVLQQQTDGALAEAHAQLTYTSGELAAARERLAQLEKERAELQKEAAGLKSECSALRESLARIDQDRDNMLISMDTKTEHAAMLEQRLEQRDAQVAKLKETVAELQKKLSVLMDDSAARDQSTKVLQRAVDSLREELDMVQQSKDSAVRENRRLQEELAAVTQDNRVAHRNLEESRREVETLKRQLQEYVNEVRRVEELLALKEAERTDMLEHFRSLSVEATALESSNHSLETEREEARAAVQAAKQHGDELQQCLLDREAAIHAYENQISELTVEVASLEARLRQQTDKCERQEVDLAALRQLCASLDQQKDSMSDKAVRTDIRKIHLEEEVSRLREEQEDLQAQLQDERAAISSLEDMLASSRQEALEQGDANHALQAEVTHLRDKVAHLQDKLDVESTEVRRFASQAAELTQRVTELQREVTNERFSHAQATQERSFSTTL